MRRSSIPALDVTVAVALLLTSCGPSGSEGSELPGDVLPVTQGPWVRPAAGITWQWQLSGPLNLGYDVDLYDVDLFEAPQQDLDDLHASGRTVICYFSGGSSEDWRPDFSEIPEDAMGRKLSGWDGERWLDIRRRDVFDLMLTRLDLAVSRGCDGVEPDNVDGHTNNTGFDLSPEDMLAFNRNLANAAHERGLAVALKNDGGQTEALVDYYDFELNEECHQFEECGELSPFVAAGKPVLNAEYPGSQAKAVADEAQICAAARTHSTRTLILPLDLDDSFRIACP